MAAWRANCRDLLTPSQQAGQLHPRFESLDDAADMMWSLMSIDILRALVHDRGWSGQKCGRYMGELFVAMFAAEA